MAKDARLELRLDPVLRARVDAEAERRGQKITTFVERALEKALEGAGRSPAEVTSAGKSAERKIDAPPSAPPRASKPKKGPDLRDTWAR